MSGGGGPSRERYHGQIAGVGSTSGVRIVVGSWVATPIGPFADAMVERADGHRVLLAPDAAVRDVIESTYVFDEVRLEPVTVQVGRSAGGLQWVLTSPSLRLTIGLGGRRPLGVLLRAVPGRVATSTTWATLVDPVALRVLDGVRTRGTARRGRREWYGATDLHAVTSLEGTFDRVDLGRLAPVDPPCRFGFSSTPRHPGVTTVVTTIETR
ncbi:MAG: hypothetical protein ABIW80_00855 [Lapillicoccus sp.]